MGLGRVALQGLDRAAFETKDETDEMRRYLLGLRPVHRHDILGIEPQHPARHRALEPRDRRIERQGRARRRSRLLCRERIEAARGERDLPEPVGRHHNIGGLPEFAAGAVCGLGNLRLVGEEQRQAGVRVEKGRAGAVDARP
jgi:hypothetical protein